ncbi:MAG: VOC family protein [Anaerolineae bacterium]
MQIRPFLVFHGQCNEAIELYSRAFNTSVSQVMRFSNLPANPARPVPEIYLNWVVMATLPMGNNFIRLSDTMGSLNEAVTDRLAISVECSCAEVQHAFAVLAEEGTVSNPLQASFFSPCYGSLHDKFGVFWNFVGQADEG